VFIDPSTMSFMDALGGPAALKEDPLSVPPYDRSRPDLLTKSQKAELRVFDGIDRTAAIMRSAALNKSLPVRVITVGRPWWPTADRNLAWRAAHERLAGSVSDGRLIVAERSGHLVTRDEPDLIVTTVSELVRQVRVEK
jgi:pimeloyl-ACP methyl ester carboxylesterase